MNDSNLESAWKLRLESEIEKLASENAALKAEEERLKDTPGGKRLLSQAPVVVSLDPNDRKMGWYNEREHMRDKYTHTARLIGVKEIKKDTAESLLKEIIEQLDMRLKDCGGGEYRFATSDALERARKLLEEKE